MNPRRLARLAPWALALSVAVAVAFLAVGQLQGLNVREDLAKLDPWSIPLALGLHVAAHVLWGSRIAVLGSIPAFSGWRLVTAGTFGGAVTPGRIGGEGLKLALLVRGGMPGSHATRLLLADRALDLVFFVGMGLVAMLVLPTIYDAPQAAFFAGLGTLVLGAFTALLVLALWKPDRTAAFVTRVLGGIGRLLRREAPAQETARRFVREVQRGFVAIVATRPLRLGAAVALTAANWVAEYAALWYLLRGFGLDVSYPTVFLVGIIVTLISNIPITPGGTGVAETTALALLGPIGAAPIVIVIWRALGYWYDVLIGALVAWWSWGHPFGRN